MEIKMDTNSFVDLIKKFGTNNQENFNNKNSFEQKSSGQSPNINLDNMYPYGKFPVEKTKGYDPSLHKKSQVETLSEPAPNNFKKEENPQKTGMGDLFGNLDLKTILPLMTNIKNKNKLNTYDLFNLLMPTMYKDNPNLKEIVKYFSKNEESPKPKLPPSKMQAIDSYVKA